MDDLLIARESIKNINALKAALSKKFKISDLGACYFYLGIEVIRDRSCRELQLS